MTAEVEFRQATEADASAISHLIYDTARLFITGQFSEQAKQIFYHSVTAISIRNAIKTNVCYHVAEHNGALIGVIGIRDHTHLYHLFVEGSAQKQGIGQRLWQVALANNLSGASVTQITVNSADSALPFYRKLGFEACGQTFEKMGIVATPMRYVIK